MDAAKHTPGPWTAFDTPHCIGVFANAADVAHCDGFHIGGRTRGEELANARLIAAAPEMLEALQGIDHFSDAIAFRTDTLSVELRKWIEAGRSAIAKAEGRSDG